MASVSAPARPRKARALVAPSPVPQPNARLEEGWQPGGKAQPVAQPARHGVCRLTLQIGGTDYRLRPFPAAEGSGLVAIWTLRKAGGPEPVAYAVASDGEVARCTCPDHEHNGALCKHIMALAALRLIPAPSRPEGGAL